MRCSRHHGQQIFIRKSQTECRFPARQWKGSARHAESGNLEGKEEVRRRSQRVGGGKREVKRERGGIRREESGTKRDGGGSSEGRRVDLGAEQVNKNSGRKGEEKQNQENQDKEQVQRLTDPAEAT
eukprot:749223-Hanusia_phi.AAC.5